MSKSIFLFIFLVLNFHVEGQNQKSKISEDSIINKWIKACVNLEARPNFFVSKIWADWQQKNKNGLLNRQMMKQVQEDYRRKIYRATALFLIYKNKHYLITARHFLIDSEASQPNYVYEKIFLGDNGSKVLKPKDSKVDTRPEVRYFDGHNGGKNPKYILSDEKRDIGIIALDDIPVMGRQFVAMLYDKGYRPIKYSDLDTKESLVKNKPIIAVGFPGELSELKKYRKNIDSSINHWQSAFITVPVVSTGQIKNIHRDSFYFTGNIFSYHGNSGGPIISNNKLVGLNIAYGGPLKNTKTELLNYYIDETAYFSKASNIITLLKTLEVKFIPNNKPYVVMKNYKDSLTGIISGGLITVQ
jgi:Trypsin-like peptidase domain